QGEAEEPACQAAAGVDIESDGVGVAEDCGQAMRGAQGAVDQLIERLIDQARNVDGQSDLALGAIQEAGAAEADRSRRGQVWAGGLRDCFDKLLGGGAYEGGAFARPFNLAVAQ